MMPYRTELFYKDICDIVDGRGMSVITLVDAEERKALLVVCDCLMKDQIEIRYEEPNLCSKMLPGVFASLLKDLGGSERYEMEIYGVVNGEYQTVLTDTSNNNQYQIRLSDGILLSIVSDIPIYISNILMMSQCVDYNKQSNGKMALPINALSLSCLEDELSKAISKEDYRLASLIKDEIARRKDLENN